MLWSVSVCFDVVSPVLIRFSCHWLSDPALRFKTRHGRLDLAGRGRGRGGQKLRFGDVLRIGDPNEVTGSPEIVDDGPNCLTVDCRVVMCGLRVSVCVRQNMDWGCLSNCMHAFIRCIHCYLCI